VARVQRHKFEGDPGSASNMTSGAGSYPCNGARGGEEKGSMRRSSMVVRRMVAGGDSGWALAALCKEEGVSGSSIRRKTA
jgi:hypothetical protein